MIGVLAGSLDDALRSLCHAVESTSGGRREPGGLLALADRVGRALTGRGVAHMKELEGNASAIRNVEKPTPQPTSATLAPSLSFCTAPSKDGSHDWTMLLR